MSTDRQKEVHTKPAEGRLQGGAQGQSLRAVRGESGREGSQGHQDREEKIMIPVTDNMR